MENKNNPLSPHLQIYSWNISSLLSITHRIVGVINTIAIIFICLWLILLSFGESNYELIQIFLQSFYGKFFTIALSWSFSFHILNEIRHLVWDMGYGFDLKTSQITGIITISGSFILAILIYLFARNVI
ncbi:MAG: succinate dehydrogenase, cytochrome b556 subunit [Alphaproteobacteria bacterium]|jgi:succinate dehydrogenase / fumarate reductase cytochrome b subunit|nr:succinate dehydrogenase, cytochrome b556 subunit [Alphaproteobacteria bacterium]